MLSVVVYSPYFINIGRVGIVNYHNDIESKGSPLYGEFENVAQSLVRPLQTARFKREKMMTKRIPEKCLYIPMLQIANRQPDKFILTSKLIAELEKIFHPEGVDADILDRRSDTKFSQKVRNIISHKKTSNNPIARGFAVHDSALRGIKITPKGQKFLANLGGSL